MKDTVGKAEVTWNDDVQMRNNHGKPAGTGSSWDDDTKPQPLANLFQYNMIMSPSHEEEGEGKAPVVGEIIDFDAHIMPDVPDTTSTPHEVSSSSSRSASEEQSNKHTQKVGGNEEVEDDEEDEVGSIDESILNIAMFEGVLHDGHVELVTSDEDLAPLPAIITTHKRPADEKLPPPPKKTKTTRAPRNTKTTRAFKAPAPSLVVSPPRNEAAAEEEKKMPPPPRQRRPNCLFVNHFGTRLNEKGQAVRVNVPSTNRTPARISCEESVSLKTKSTGRSSKAYTATSNDSKKTPVKARSTASITAPPSVPSVVRIVTPSMKKPIKSSCLEDITMEEDILEPIKHDEMENEGILNSSHLPYLHSISDSAPQSPTPPSPSTARMMHTMMPGSMMTFNRPFPLLQRRAFLAASGCHPMAHPAAAAAFAAGAAYYPPFPGPGMPFPSHLSFPTPHAVSNPSHISSTSSNSPVPSQAKSQASSQKPLSG